MNTRDEWRTRIVTTPDTCHGKARVRGTRVMASVVLDNLAAGYSPDDILADYPSLELADVQACMAYAAELARETVLPSKVDDAA